MGTPVCLSVARGWYAVSPRVTQGGGAASTASPREESLSDRNPPRTTSFLTSRRDRDPVLLGATLIQTTARSRQHGPVGVPEPTIFVYPVWVSTEQSMVAAVWVNSCPGSNDARAHRRIPVARTLPKTRSLVSHGPGCVTSNPTHPMMHDVHSASGFRRYCSRRSTFMAGVENRQLSDPSPTHLR